MKNNRDQVFVIEHIATGRRLHLRHGLWGLACSLIDSMQDTKGKWTNLPLRGEKLDKGIQEATTSSVGKLYKSRRAAEKTLGYVPDYVRHQFQVKSIM